MQKHPRADRAPREAHDRDVERGHWGDARRLGAIACPRLLDREREHLCEGRDSPLNARGDAPGARLLDHGDAGQGDPELIEIHPQMPQRRHQATFFAMDCATIDGLFRLRTHNQNMTVAAMQIALMKVWAQRSYRVAILRQSLSLPNMRSMRLRCL
jgi:hypothetical protein